MGRPDTQATRGEKRRKAPLYRRLPDARSIRLTERDALVLEALRGHRCLSADQLRRLVFRCGASMVRRRLRDLYDHGFVDRVRVAAAPTRGVPPFVYVLTRQGVDVLPDLLSRFRPDLAAAWGQRPQVRGVGAAGLRFVVHRHIVNELHVVLEEAARERGYTVRWQHEEDLMVVRQGNRQRAETVKDARLPKATTFLPDGFFELRTAKGDCYAFFVEVDLSTHPQRVWRERARLYTVYGDPAAGLFRRRFGRETFRLAVITRNDYRQRSRCDNILRTIRQTVGPSDMFLGTTLGFLTADRILGPCWRVDDGTDRRVALVPAASGPVHVRGGPQVVVAKRGAFRGTV